jgi:hypothetical protein
MKRIVVLAAFVLAPFAATAQTEVIIAEGGASPVIVKDVTKKSADPATKDTVLAPPAFTYKLQPKQIPVEFTTDTIPAAKLASEPVSKLYRTYTRAGVGNYGMLYGEIDAMSMRSKNGAWHAHARHFSAFTGPKDVQGFAGFSQTAVDLRGKRFLKKHTLGGNLGYDRNVVHYYGSADTSLSFEKKDIRQRFQLFTAGGELQSHLSGDEAINHHFRLDYHFLGDAFKANENNIRFVASGERIIRGNEFLTAELGVDYNRNAIPTDTALNTFGWLKPMYHAQNDLFDAAIGIGIYQESKVPGATGASTYFYPQGHISVKLLHNMLVPYFTLTGSLERNSYRSLTDVNPFLLTSQSTALRNTQHKFDVAAGVRGSITSNLAYDIRAGRFELVNAPFFVNTVSAQDAQQNKFAIVWDTAQVFTAHAQLAWQQREKLNIIATADWFQYDMNSQQHPWHTPTLRLSLTGQYNLRDKIIVRMQTYYLNGQYARTADSTGTVYSAVLLKGLIDVNVGFEYRYTKFLSLFANFNNVASQRYYRWNAYPTQRFNMLAGLTFTF